jgi:hypothetical protein
MIGHREARALTIAIRERLDQRFPPRRQRLALSKS